MTNTDGRLPGAVDTTDEIPELVDALVQFSFLIQEILSSNAAQAGLSMSMVRMLGILRDRQPGIIELADALHLDKSSVTGLVDRAETRGLVARVAAIHDGRAIQVTLTDQGHALAHDFAGVVAGEISKLVAELSDLERQKLSELTGRIAGQASRSIVSH